MARTTHPEKHRTSRIGWLRAAVLGANDGIVSTASLMLGVAAAGADRHAWMLAGVSGLVAGAMSMAAGEYVSVSSQYDTEQADLAREKAEQIAQPASEHAELAAIYVARGLQPALAKEVAQQLMARDALGAHARDELGITVAAGANPVQAAFTSALTFATGAALPLAAALLAPATAMVAVMVVVSVFSLSALGALGAWTGGAAVPRATLRVAFWGLFAMGLTAAVGKWFGGAAPGL